MYKSINDKNIFISRICKEINCLFVECEEPNISQEYLLESNEFIRSKCVETAVSFIYLPRPPVSPDLHVQYLHQLDLLTRGLPPSILVHGVSPVMTTTL